MLRLVLTRLESTAGGVQAALATYGRLASLAMDKDLAPPHLSWSTTAADDTRG